MTSPAAPATDPWADVVGQERAVAQLRAAAASPVHAYLLVGPEGWGARPVARAFAAEVLSAGVPAGSAEAARVRRLVLAESFADFVVAPASGNVLLRDEIDEAVRKAFLVPVEGARKVVLLPRIHTAGAAQWSRLLKPIEEPPPSTVWVLLADQLPADMATITSRSTVVQLEPVPPSAVVARLVAEGHEEAAASVAASVSGGDLALARLLVDDGRLAGRVAAWAAVPSQLDGTGHAVWRLVAELRAAIDDALAHVKGAFDAAEVALAEQSKELGLRRGLLTELKESHARQLRRARTSELRLGLAALAGAYRDAGDHSALVQAVPAVDDTYELLVERNANEALQLQSLFLRLPRLAGR